MVMWRVGCSVVERLDFSYEALFAESYLDCPVVLEKAMAN